MGINRSKLELAKLLVSMLGAACGTALLISTGCCSNADSDEALPALCATSCTQQRDSGNVMFCQFHPSMFLLISMLSRNLEYL